MRRSWTIISSALAVVALATCAAAAAAREEPSTSQPAARASAAREPAARVATPGALAGEPAGRPETVWSRGTARDAAEVGGAQPVRVRFSNGGGAGQSDSSGRSRVPPSAGSGGGRSGGTSSGASGGGRTTASSGGSGHRSGGSSTTSTGASGTAQPRQRYPTRGADGSYAAGYAVPRGTVPAYPIHRPPYHPWYGSWYPWGFGSWGLGFYFWDPYWYGSPYQYGYGYVGGGYEECGVRILVKPRDAQVFVDGFYVGVVDEFDGVFQKLRLDEGPHRIEIRKEGFETLRFDVRTTYDHTIKLRGELEPAQP